MKHIGIVCVSYEGAALCFQEICSEGVKLLGDYQHPEVSMHAFSMSDYAKCAFEGDWEGIANLLTLSGEKAIAAGADFLICTSNTTHQAFPLMEGRNSKPWLHIAEVVGQKAQEEGFQKLGILGTKLLMQGDVYSSKLSPLGIEMLTPELDVQEQINEMIFSKLVHGIVTLETREFFKSVAGDLVRRGCDAVVMGCTEIPLTLSSEDVKFPLLDSTRLLGQAALLEALRGD